MILNQFPDINWLREQAKNNFKNAKGVNNQPLAQKGWPSVVLNTTSYGAERNDIKAPFSLFLNLSGKSLVKSAGRSIELTSDNLCLVNKGDFYDLVIPEGNCTNTFNVHFGDKLYSEVIQFESNSTLNLLDNPFAKNHSLAFNLPTKSRWRNGQINQHIHALRGFYSRPGQSIYEEYELLANLLSTLLVQCNSDILSHQLKTLKPSTQQELLNRVSLSVDYIHTHYQEAISLDQLSTIACMSKYHYLRTFKMIHYCTPQQMVAQLRFEKATRLLKENRNPLAEIATILGFSELAAFTRFFSKHAGLSPKAFRLQN